MPLNFWWGDNQKGNKMHQIKWHELCNSKQQEALVLDLQYFNKTIFSKKVWRLYSESNFVLVWNLKAKYYLDIDTLKAKFRRRPSYILRSIHHSSWIINKGSYWNISKGNKINIQKDKQIPTQHGFKILTQKPLDIKTSGVTNLFDEENGCWYIRTINNMFIFIDRESIIKTPLYNPDEDNILSWKSKKDVHYSVKTGYYRVKKWKRNNDIECSDINTNKDLWKMVWNIQVTLRQQCLLWILLTNSLPVKQNINNRGIHLILCALGATQDLSP